MFETLSADELVYHQRVRSGLADAQAANRSWIEHLIQKYQLGPEDLINLDGRIQRKTNIISDNSANTNA